MRLTPGQVEELRGPANVRGAAIDGNMPTPLFRVVVDHTAFERVQVLTHARALPSGLAWYVALSHPSGVELHTTRPEWFVEMQEMINAQRRADPTTR